jgi:predicted small lipoprotein YifL
VSAGWRAGRLLPAVAIALILAGCGQKGPLYLPDKGGQVVTSPAAAPASPPAQAPQSAPGEAPQSTPTQPPQSAPTQLPEAPTAAPKKTDKDSDDSQTPPH